MNNIRKFEEFINESVVAEFEETKQGKEYFYSLYLKLKNNGLSNDKAQDILDQYHKYIYEYFIDGISVNQCVENILTKFFHDRSLRENHNEKNKNNIKDMKNVKKFDEFINEGFERIKPRRFAPIGLKKIATKYFNLCKNDEELIKLVDNFLIERPSYSEGPEPRPASDALRGKLKELFPKNSNEELYKDYHVYYPTEILTRTGSSYEVSAYDHLLRKLIEKK